LQDVREQHGKFIVAVDSQAIIGFVFGVVQERKN